MITRDALGIPHVRGGDVFDLAAAQGEVTAHDRGWQIEVDRRRAEGTLAALIGPAGLDWDVFARRARLDDTARRAFTALGDEDRAFVAAYVDGVRRGMRDVGSGAAEFAELDARFSDGAPLDDWPVHAPLGILHVAHALFSSFPNLLWAEHVAHTLGDDWVGPLSGADDAEPASGSNAWAVHGSLTSSGLPLLAGDPHRLFELPGVYQQVGLACDEFDVIGLAFPGVPGVPHFGHTGDAAWGVTNALAHSVDVFRERLRRVSAGRAAAGPAGDPSADPTAPRYAALGPDGWHAVSVTRSLIGVRGAEPVLVDAIETERGTVVTDLVARPDGDFDAWSVRMPARVDADLGFGALLPLLRARSADDVLAAFEHWTDPVNRVLTADRDGNVRSATVGRAPDRVREHRVRPLDATVSHAVANRRMPAATEITSIAVDANERPARDDVDLGSVYAPPHRARRIRSLLESRRPATTDELDAIWGDTLLGGLPEWRALLADADADADADARSLASAAAATDLRDGLLDWDGRMDAASTTAARFASFREALVRRVAALPELVPLGEAHPFGAIFDPWMGAPGRIAAALPGLLFSAPLSRTATSSCARPSPTRPSPTRPPAPTPPPNTHLSVRTPGATGIGSSRCTCSSTFRAPPTRARRSASRSRATGRPCAAPAPRPASPGAVGGDPSRVGRGISATAT